MVIYNKREKEMKKSISLVAIIALLFGGLCFAEYVPCKVSLNLFERLVVLGLLPKESNFATLKIVGDLQKELAPTEEEFKQAGLTTMEDGSGIQAKDWFAVPEKEFTLGEIAEGIIVDALKKLDNSKKLKPEHISIFKKFIDKKNK